MFSNGFATIRVGRAIGLDFNCAAIGLQTKMMSRHFMAEAHALIAAPINGVKMSVAVVLKWGRGRFRLLSKGCTQPEESETNQQSHGFHIVAFNYLVVWSN